jgi:N-acetylmuramoyl-L-alanine amidase
VRKTLFCALVLCLVGTAPPLISAQQQPLPSPPAETPSPAAPPAPAAGTAPNVPAAPPKPAPSIPAVTVVVDPAHGGSDAGARGASGVLESDVVLNFARVLRLALEAQGIRALLTREGNQDPSFDDRSMLINGLRGAIFISLHVASTGPVGTVRAYWYGGVTGDLPEASATTEARAAGGRPAVATRGGLVLWNRAQESHREASRRLADLAQIQLAQKFRGSPEVPEPAPVRQLRTIAGPAIAVEVSSVAVSDPGQLQQMARPLADSITRAVTDFAAVGAGAGAAAAGAARGGTN